MRTTGFWNNLHQVLVQSKDKVDTLWSVRKNMNVNKTIYPQSYSVTNHMRTMFVRVRVRFMVFNATLNNISIIL